MFSSLARAVFGTSNDRVLKGFKRRVAAISALEPQIAALDDAALAAKTAEFKARLEAGEKLDGLLAEAFAVVREASSRVLGMRQNQRALHIRVTMPARGQHEVPVPHRAGPFEELLNFFDLHDVGPPDCTSEEPPVSTIGTTPACSIPDGPVPQSGGFRRTRLRPGSKWLRFK